MGPNDGRCIVWTMEYVTAREKWKDAATERAQTTPDASFGLYAVIHKIRDRRKMEGATTKMGTDDAGHVIGALGSIYEYTTLEGSNDENSPKRRKTCRLGH